MKPVDTSRKPDATSYMGPALQEWGLLEEVEKEDWGQAVTALRARLDPGSKVLAAQDFRHTSLKVSDFVRID